MSIFSFHRWLYGFSGNEVSFIVSGLVLHRAQVTLVQEYNSLKVSLVFRYVRGYVHVWFADFLCCGEIDSPDVPVDVWCYSQLKWFIAFLCLQILPIPLDTSKQVLFFLSFFLFCIVMTNIFCNFPACACICMCRIVVASNGYFLLEVLVRYGGKDRVVAIDVDYSVFS